MISKKDQGGRQLFKTELIEWGRDHCSQAKSEADFRVAETNCRDGPDDQGGQIFGDQREKPGVQRAATQEKRLIAVDQPLLNSSERKTRLIQESCAEQRWLVGVFAL